jgi:hypothetical protein
MSSEQIRRFLLEEKYEKDVLTEFDWKLPEIAKDVGHFALDVIGIVPKIGFVADLLNATWYWKDDEYLMAGLSAICAIPIFGTVGPLIRAALKEGKALTVTPTMSKLFYKAAPDIERIIMKLGRSTGQPNKAKKTWEVTAELFGYAKKGKSTFKTTTVHLTALPASKVAFKSSKEAVKFLDNALKAQATTRLTKKGFRKLQKQMAEKGVQLKKIGSVEKIIPPGATMQDVLRGARKLNLLGHGVWWSSVGLGYDPLIKGLTRFHIAPGVRVLKITYDVLKLTDTEGNTTKVDTSHGLSGLLGGGGTKSPSSGGGGFEGSKDRTTKIKVWKKCPDNRLELGCHGQNVKELQKVLMFLGYDMGSKGDDQKYGPGTRDAVKKFQQDAFPNNSEEWDGIFGDDTRNALLVKIKGNIPTGVNEALNIHKEQVLIERLEKLTKGLV